MLGGPPRCRESLRGDGSSQRPQLPLRPNYVNRRITSVAATLVGLVQVQSGPRHRDLPAETFIWCFGSIAAASVNRLGTAVLEGIPSRLSLSSNQAPLSRTGGPFRRAWPAVMTLGWAASRRGPPRPGRRGSPAGHTVRDSGRQTPRHTRPGTRPGGRDEGDGGEPVGRGLEELDDAPQRPGRLWSSTIGERVPSKSRQRATSPARSASGAACSATEVSAVMACAPARPRAPGRGRVRSSGRGRGPGSAGPRRGVS